MKNDKPRSRISPWVAAPPIIFLTLAVLFFLGLNRQDPNGLPSTMIGRDAPKLTLTQLSDLPELTSADLKKGGVKLVNFWASWCGPCRVEHPTLKAMADEGIVIYGINYKDQKRNAMSFLNSLGNPYLKSAADNGRTGIDWGITGVPETFILDAKGKVLFRFAGPITKRVLENTIRPVLDSQ
ncbi:MAG: DsbE family thiol:disulfide interchange protein [Rhodobacterales bacterium]